MGGIVRLSFWNASHPAGVPRPLAGSDGYGHDAAGDFILAERGGARMDNPSRRAVAPHFDWHPNVAMVEIDRMGHCDRGAERIVGRRID